MIGDLKPHAAYKDSGQDWLGSIPAHWGLLRAKRLFREVDERSKTGKEELLSVSHLTGVTPRRLKTVTMFMAESNVGHKVCRPGDLVINTLWAWMAALGVTRHTGLVSPAYGVYRPIDGGGMLPAYADHLLRTPMYAAEYQRRSTGVNSSRLRLYPEQFLRIAVLVPPLDEQVLIVRFLDWVNRRLESAIRAKRKVIALLTEQKNAIVRRAITHGLDQCVPLKSTGVRWLGDIPQHWEVRRLKHLARFQSGDGITSLQIEETGSFPVYGGNGLRGYATRYTHDGDYALIGRQGALCGNINFASGKFFASEHAVVPTLQPGVSVAWFGELLRVMNLNQYSQSAAQPGLAVERIKNLYAPVPPSDEQQRLVESFERSTAPITTGISRLEREIDLLREYRARLVADVVTGQLDVREAAARLPVVTTPVVTDDLSAETDETELTDEEAEA